MDPIFEAAQVFVTTLLENPVIGSLIYAGARTCTGYLQKKWKGTTGRDFSKKELAANVLKYEVAVNGLIPVLSMFGTVDVKYVGALVLIADILGSWGRKLKNGV